MRSKAIESVFAIAVLVLGAGAEELLPKFCGVGFPLLLAAAVLLAVRRGLIETCIFAIAAGAMEDAVSGLPMMTSASYFLVPALFARWTGCPRLTAMVAYLGYQVWIAIWIGIGNGGVPVRMLMSLPMGLVTALVTGVVLEMVDRRAAIVEAG